jgi:hypothetical protein
VTFELIFYYKQVHYLDRYIQVDFIYTVLWRQKKRKFAASSTDDWDTPFTSNFRDIFRHDFEQNAFTSSFLFWKYRWMIALNSFSQKISFSKNSFISRYIVELKRIKTLENRHKFTTTFCIITPFYRFPQKECVTLKGILTKKNSAWRHD